MSRRVTCLVTVALAALAISPVAAGGPTSTQGHWVLQKSPSTRDLLDVSCSSRTECVAVGASATIIRTVNAGQTWAPVKSR